MNCLFHALLSLGGVRVVVLVLMREAKAAEWGEEGGTGDGSSDNDLYRMLHCFTVPIK